jgi:hypothetical protein
MKRRGALVAGLELRKGNRVAFVADAGDVVCR